MVPPWVQPGFPTSGAQWIAARGEEALRVTWGPGGLPASGTSGPNAPCTPPQSFFYLQAGDPDDLARGKLVASGQQLPSPPEGLRGHRGCPRYFHRGHWSSGVLDVSLVLRHFLFHLCLVHPLPPTFLETEKGERERKTVNFRRSSSTETV